MRFVRIAETFPEKQSIYSFRYRVFADHLGRKDLDGLDHDHKVLMDALDEHSNHYYLGNLNEPIASISVSPVASENFPKELFDFLDIASLSKAVPTKQMAFVNWLLVDPHYAASSAILNLLSEAYEEALRTEVKLVLTFCRPGLVHFYERLGFEQYTHSTNLKNIGLRSPLLLIVNDGARLKAIRSPLFRTFSKVGTADSSDDIRLALEPIMDPYQAAQILINDELWLDDAIRFMAPARPKLLDVVSGDAMRFIMSTCSVIACKRGEKIIAHDETSDDMYLIVSGTFLRKSRGNKSEEILKEGDTFGELEHLSGTARKEEVTALSAGHVVALSAKSLFQWMRQDPKIGVEVAINLARIVAKRL